jgi:acyl-CoA thioesterase I
VPRSQHLASPSAFSLFLLVLAFALAACGESLTFGTGAAEHESYPAQLEQLIGRRVVRAGGPGEVTATALARLPEMLDEHSPKLLLLCIGGNDFLRRLGNPQAEANVRAMVKLARSRGVEVLLIGTPEPGFRVSPPPFYAGIAMDFGLAEVRSDPSQRARLPRHRRAPGRAAEA